MERNKKRVKSLKRLRSLKERAFEKHVLETFSFREKKMMFLKIEKMIKNELVKVQREIFEKTNELKLTEFAFPHINDPYNEIYLKICDKNKTFIYSINIIKTIADFELRITKENSFKVDSFLLTEYDNFKQWCINNKVNTNIADLIIFYIEKSIKFQE